MRASVMPSSYLSITVSVGARGVSVMDECMHRGVESPACVLRVERGRRYEKCRGRARCPPHVAKSTKSEETRNVGAPRAALRRRNFNMGF